MSGIRSMFIFATDLEALSTVIARPEVVTGPGGGDGHAKTEPDGASHDETTAARVTGGGENLDSRNCHVGKKERRHAAKDAVGDGREERSDLFVAEKRGGGGGRGVLKSSG